MNEKIKHVQTKFTLNTIDAGKRLRLFRKSRNFTIQEMAELTGIDSKIIADSEKGVSPPTLSLLLALLNLFGLNMNWVLAGAGKMILEKSANGRETGNKKDSFANDANQLLWYLENAPVVKYAVLGFFREYIHKNRDIIEENIRAVKEKNQVNGE